MKIKHMNKDNGQQQKEEKIKMIGYKLTGWIEKKETKTTYKDKQIKMKWKKNGILFDAFTDLVSCRLHFTTINCWLDWQSINCNCINKNIQYYENIELIFCKFFNRKFMTIIYLAFNNWNSVHFFCSLSPERLLIAAKILEISNKFDL